MKVRKLVMAFFAATAGFISCSDENQITTSQVTISTQFNSAISGMELTKGTYTFTNVNTAVETTAQHPATTAEITDGLYHVTFIGEATYTQGEERITVGVQGVQQNVTVSGGTYNLQLTLHIINANQDDFVIAELFLPGTVNPQTNKAYTGDQYVRIYNNSDKVLYADGLVFMESKFITTQKSHQVTPDIMSEAMAVQSVVVVPGNGTTYPIQPGESFIICDNATNHQEANEGSFDLSQAAFEWYFESKSDADNPNVPNMDIYYCYTNTIWILSKQANKAYAIGRLHNITKEEYVENYTYSYDYKLKDGTTGKTQHTYKFPNAWIIDAVNVGSVNGWEWNVIDASLDMGHTYIGENNTVAENYGKAIVRKVSYVDGERKVLQDTNNSGIDFTPATTATLLP